MEGDDVLGSLLSLLAFLQTLNSFSPWRFILYVLNVLSDTRRCRYLDCMVVVGVLIGGTYLAFTAKRNFP